MPTPPKISESVDVFSHGRDVFIESHVPWVDSQFYHAHPSIEINYLRDCEMRYSFSGDPVDVPRERLCMFWAAYPHRVTHVFGQGRITNAYVTLQQFLNWSLPPDMVDQVMSGAIICSQNLDPLDQPLVARWANELDNSNPELQRLHRHEVRARLLRLGIEGWGQISPPRTTSGGMRIGGRAVESFDAMMRFVASNMFEPITVQDVADAAGISRNYAITLFKKMLGMTVKSYLSDLRIRHAKMLLAETDNKIVSVAFDCGFVSLSSFYEVFGKATGQSPAAYRDNHMT